MTARWHRWRDRRAAARMLSRLHVRAGRRKTGNERVIEAWLWQAWGDDDMAVAVLTVDE